MYLLAYSIQVEQEISKMSFMTVYVVLSNYSPPSPRGVLAPSKYTYIALWVDKTVADTPIMFGYNLDKSSSVTIHSKLKFKPWIFSLLDYFCSSTIHRLEDITARHPLNKCSNVFAAIQGEQITKLGGPKY